MRKTSYIFILVFSILFLFSFEGFCQQINNARINLELKDVSLKDALKAIEKVTSFTFLAKAEDIESELHVTIRASNQPLNTILEKLFAGRNLEYKQVDGNIFIKRSIIKPGNTSPV